MHVIEIILENNVIQLTGELIITFKMLFELYSSGNEHINYVPTIKTVDDSLLLC